jgi:hypothetical protein
MPTRINHHHHSTTTMFMIILNELQVTHAFNLKNTNMSFHQDLRHCEAKRVTRACTRILSERSRSSRT